MAILVGFFFLVIFGIYFYKKILPEFKKLEKKAERMHDKYEKKLEGLKDKRKKK